MAKLTHLIKYGRTRKTIEKNLVKVNFLGKTVSVHKKVLKNFQVAHLRIRRHERALKLKPFKPRLIGTYIWRNMRGKRRLSEHALGVAIDLNWDRCLYGNRRLKFGRCDIPQYVIKLMIKSGFNWGGHWRTLKDFMHFEIR